MLLCRDQFCLWAVQLEDGDVLVAGPPWMQPWFEQTWPDAAIYTQPVVMPKEDNWIHTIVTWADWRIVQAQTQIRHPRRRPDPRSILSMASNYAKGPK